MLQANDEILLCPLVELGVIRVGLQTRYFPNRATAQRLLANLRLGRAAVLRVADARHADTLPVWCQAAAQVADAHLVDLAHSLGARLATLDTGIPGVAPV
jgi:hypothetical protein